MENNELIFDSRNPLFSKADILARRIYQITRDFPKSEIFSLTSQIRRSGLSVILNIIEGFARNNPKEFKRFLFIAFGSLKETKYLLFFATEQQYISKQTYQELINLSSEIAKIIWTIVHKK